MFTWRLANKMVMDVVRIQQWMFAVDSTLRAVDPIPLCIFTAVGYMFVFPYRGCLSRTSSLAVNTVTGLV